MYTQLDASTTKIDDIGLARWLLRDESMIIQTLCKVTCAPTGDPVQPGELGGR